MTQNNRLSRVLEDTEQVHDLLFGVQIACVFAIVGLISFAAGWIKSVRANVDVAETPTVLASFGPEPVPEWVRTGLLIATAALILAAVADAYVLVEYDDVNVRKWIHERTGLGTEGEST